MANTYLNVGGTGTGSGEANTASSVGSDPDKEIVAGKEGVDLKFKRLSAGAGITLDDETNPDAISISATGGAANAFSTISGGNNVNGPLTADSETDTLTLKSTNGTVDITADGADDSVNFTVNNSLLGLSDTFVSSPNTGDVLTYNSGRWENATPEAGGATELDGLTDVNTAGVQDNQVLTYNAGTWAPATPALGGATELDGLTDVNTAGAQNGQVLTYNGGTWYPTEAGGGGGVTILNSGEHIAPNSTIEGDLILLGDHTFQGTQTTSSINVKGSIYVENGATIQCNDNVFLYVHGNIYCNKITTPAFFDFRTYNFNKTSSFYCRGSVYNCSIDASSQVVTGMPSSDGGLIYIGGNFISPNGFITSNATLSANQGAYGAHGGNITVEGSLVIETVTANGGASTGNNPLPSGNGGSLTVGADLTVLNSITLNGASSINNTNSGNGGSLIVGGNLTQEGLSGISLVGGSAEGASGKGGNGGTVTVGGSTVMNFINLSGGNGTEGGSGATGSDDVVFKGHVSASTITMNGGRSVGASINGGNAVAQPKFLGGVNITSIINAKGGRAVGGGGAERGAGSINLLFRGGGFIETLDVREDNVGVESSTSSDVRFENGTYYVTALYRTDKSEGIKNKVSGNNSLVRFANMSYSTDTILYSGDGTATTPQSSSIGSGLYNFQNAFVARLGDFLSVMP